MINKPYLFDVVVMDRLSEDYPALISHVLTVGDTVTSRIGNTREILDLRLVLNYPEYALVGRDGMSDDFAYEELTQILAGVHVNERLGAIVPRAAELITPATAYGPRSMAQLDAVCAELERAPQSRRAVVYIGRPDDLLHADDPDRAAEMPCTGIWQFHLRNEELHMAVYMRSWDLVWGLSYDVPSFVAVQLAVADHLNAGIGQYVHTAGSAHVYEKHFDMGYWDRYWDRDGRGGLLSIDHLLGGKMAATRGLARKHIGLEETT